jgi:hypothetical protein
LIFRAYGTKHKIIGATTIVIITMTRLLATVKGKPSLAIIIVTIVGPFGVNLFLAWMKAILSVCLSNEVQVSDV